MENVSQRETRGNRTNVIYFPFDQIFGVYIYHWKQIENKSCVFMPTNKNKRKVVLIWPNKHKCLQFYNSNEMVRMNWYSIVIELAFCFPLYSNFFPKMEINFFLLRVNTQKKPQ